MRGDVYKRQGEGCFCHGTAVGGPVCQDCRLSGVSWRKLNKEALSFRIHDRNIYELSTMDINELYDWLVHVDPYLSSKQQQIAGEILKEIRKRLKFLLDVGLDLSLIHISLYPPWNVDSYSWFSARWR